MLELKLTNLQQSDNKALVFTDNTGTGTTGWANGANPAVTTITTNGAAPALELKLTLKRLSGATSFDYIDLGADPDFGGPYTSPTELVFTITPLKLKVSGTSPYTADSLIEDGIYDVVYVYDRGGAGESIFTETIFIQGQVKNTCYEHLRVLPAIYNSYDSRSQEISNTLLETAFLFSFDASAYVALESDLLTTLDALEKLQTNGSNYTWQL